MANYDSFLFEGHGKSEKTGNFDPGAVNGNITENQLTEAICKSTQKYLAYINKTIHYDENNYADKDLSGNTYRANCGIEVHINSAIGASGVEIFVPCKERVILKDAELIFKIAKELNIPNRGVKSRDYNSGTTYGRINGQALPYMDYYGSIRDAWERGISLSILEVGFIQEDLLKIKDNIDKIGLFIAQYIASCLNDTIYIPAPPKPVSPNPPIAPKGTLYKINTDLLNVRAGAGIGYKIITSVKKGEVYTIVETKEADGYTFGKLKSGAGWIALNYCIKK